MPKVSIGLPCYNEAPFIEETVGSILAQTEADFELLICDNASTDGTQEILKKLAQEDSRIKLHASSTNIGAPANFIKAWELATSPYFMWMGGHDRLGKDYVKKLRLVLDADPQCSLAHADAIYFARDGSDIPGEQVYEAPDVSDESPVQRFKVIVWQLIRCDIIHGLMRRERVHRPLLTSCRAPDLVLLADLALRGKFRRVPELMFFRRQVREAETPEEWKKRQEQQGVADPSQSVKESWKGTRDAHLDLPGAATLPARERHTIRLALHQAFLERHLVEWDPSTEEAGFWERLQMKAASPEGQEHIRQRIRQRVARRARLDDASTRARLEREVAMLLKENHRLRKELAKLKR